MAQRTCRNCGEPLHEASHANQRFCGQLCRNRHNNALTKSRPVRETEHGTRTGYARGCRCGQCRAYNAAYSQAQRDARPKTPKKPRSDKGVKKVFIHDEDHGTTRGYGFFRCRCERCTRAAAEYNARWRDANREKHRAYFRAYQRAHPEKYRSYSQARAAAPFEDEALAYCQIIALDPCVYCGELSETVDHIEPVSRSRNSDWSNLAPACKLCNSCKSAKALIWFLLQRAI